MAVAYVYKSFRRLPCHFWSGARRRASKCIMKKSERHLTSTLMDVWWLWLNPPHSNMGFQRVIHRDISPQKRATAGKKNLVHTTITRQETASSTISILFLLFASRENFCGCFLCKCDFEWSLKHTAPLRAQLSRRQRKVIRDESRGL